MDSFFGGITWIGILYYFNFVQTPFFAETERRSYRSDSETCSSRSVVVSLGGDGHLSRGLLLYLMRIGEMGAGLFFTSPYGVTITLGGLMGTIMFLNVWLVIWPNQQIVIASTNQVASGGQALPAAAGAARRGALTSRTNVVFSVPMLFFMGAASHYPSLVGPSASLGIFWVLVLIIIAAVEVNPLVGTQGPTKKVLDSVSGALWVGFILTGILRSIELALM